MNFIKNKLSGTMKLYSGLPRSIYILFVLRIVNAMGNFVYPFLTMFLTQRLGMNTNQVGTYFLISAAASALGSLMGGKLTDHFGRKKLFIVLQAGVALCFIPCAFLGNSIWIPRLLIAAGFMGGAAQPANSAMITDLTNKDNRKQALSLLYMGINIGFAIGPTLAGILFTSHTPWIFFGNSASIIITLLVLIFFVEETIPDKEEIEAISEENISEAAEDGGLMKALLKKPTLLLFLIGKILNQFIYSSIGFAIPLQMAKVFGTQSAVYFGLLMTFTGIVVIALTMPVTKATIKLKPIINVSLAALFYAIGFGMLGYINTLYLYFVSGLIFTIGEILEVTNSGVYIANNSPVTHRGRFNSIIPLISGLGYAFGPKLLGIFITAYGLQKLWILCFSLGVLSSIFMVWLRYFEKNIDSKKRSLSETA